MPSPSMKFQNHILNFERMDGRKDVPAQSNMPIQLFQSWGHKRSPRDSNTP